MRNSVVPWRQGGLHKIGRRAAVGIFLANGTATDGKRSANFFAFQRGVAFAMKQGSTRCQAQRGLRNGPQRSSRCIEFNAECNLAITHISWR